MRDDDGGAALHGHETVQGRLHEPLALDVQRRGSFVQQQDGGVLNETKQTG